MTAPQLALAAAIWAALPAVALAQRSDDGWVTLESAVQFGDLDLESVSGAQTMFQRLERAARWVCGARPGVERFRTRRAYLACLETALGDAVAQLDRLRVTALYEERWGEAPRRYALESPYN